MNEEIERIINEAQEGTDRLKESLSKMHYYFDDEANNLHADFENADSILYKKIIDKEFNFSFSHDDFDSLRDENHIVINGDEKEQPPVLEKTITSKNGKQVFIFKRSVSDKQKKENNQVNVGDSDIINLKIYPNPSHGKFNLKFI